MQTLSQIESSYSIRQILSGALLTFENNTFYYKNTRGGVVKDNIPFFYAFTGSSKRYVRHNYFKDAESGDMYEDVASLPSPRGVIAINGSIISNEAKANRFVRVNHQKLIDGNLETVSSEAEFVPITLNVNGYVLYNNINEMLDSFEYFSTTFSSRQKYFYHDQGVKIGASLYMPNEWSGDINYEWTFEDNNQLMNEFSIDINSYILKLDNVSTRHAGKLISGFEFAPEITQVNQAIENRGVHDRPGGLDSPFNF